MEASAPCWKEIPSVAHHFSFLFSFSDFFAVPISSKKQFQVLSVCLKYMIILRDFYLASVKLRRILDSSAKETGDRALSFF